MGDDSFIWLRLLGQVNLSFSTVEVWPDAGQREHSVCLADLRISMLQI